MQRELFFLRDSVTHKYFQKSSSTVNRTDLGNFDNAACHQSLRAAINYRHTIISDLCSDYGLRDRNANPKDWSDNAKFLASRFELKLYGIEILIAYVDEPDTVI